jgi:hypothetical protein
MVRVEPKVHELATLMTEIVIIALKIDGRALIPARLMAMTNGEYLELAPVEFNRFSLVYGTTKPKMNNETT